MESWVSFMISDILKEENINFKINKEGELIILEEDKDKVIAALNKYIGRHQNSKEEER